MKPFRDGCCVVKEHSPIRVVDHVEDVDYEIGTEAFPRQLPPDMDRSRAGALRNFYS